jgi:hypothetical protein
MLDPDGVGRSRASTISIAITPAGKLNAHYRSGQLGRFRRWPSRMKLEKSLSLVVSLVFPTQTIQHTGGRWSASRDHWDS